MGQHAVEAVGPGDGALFGPVDAAGGGLADPGVAGAGLDGGDRAAGRGEALAGGADKAAQLGVLGGEAGFRVAARVEQEAADQERLDGAAQGLLQRGGLALEGVGESEG